MWLNFNKSFHHFKSEPKKHEKKRPKNDEINVKLYLKNKKKIFCKHVSQL